MFGIGFFELLIIAVVAVVFVGPKKLPEVMRQAGKFFVQMRRTANDVRSTFDQVIREAEDDIRKQEADHLKALLAAPANPAPPATTTTAQTTATPPVEPSHDLAPHGSVPLDPHAPKTAAAGSTHDADWKNVEPAAAAATGETESKPS